jgi:hypothetical protein
MFYYGFTDFPFVGPLLTSKLELLEPTHRGLHRFVPRHLDEIEIDIGDPVYVQREAEDLWCEGKDEKISFECPERIFDFPR